MKRVITSGLVVLSLVLAACGGGASTSSPTATTAAFKPQLVSTRPADWESKFPLFAAPKPGDGSWDTVARAGELKLCAAVGINPYVYQEAGNTAVVGIEPDLAKEMVKHLNNIKITYVNVEFAGLIPGLLAGRCDAIMSGLGIFASRAQAGIRFTDPYMRFWDVVTVHKDSGINDMNGLTGKKIGSVSGSADLFMAQTYAKERGQGTTIVEFNAPSECYLAAGSRQTDACWFEVVTTSVALKANPNLKALGERLVVKREDEAINPYIQGAIGLATKKDANDLNLALSGAVTAIVKDGSQKRVLEKWAVWSADQEKFVR